VNSHLLAITIRQSSCSLFEASTLTGTRRRHARKAFLFSLGPRIGRAEAHKPGSSFTRCKSYVFLAISFLEMKKGTRLSFSPPAASSRSRQRGDPRRAAHTPPRRAGQPHTVFSPCTVRIAFSHPKSWLVKHDGRDDTSVPARSRPASRTHDFSQDVDIALIAALITTLLRSTRSPFPFPTASLALVPLRNPQASRARRSRW
jgi:hypothetical protein